MSVNVAVQPSLSPDRRRSPGNKEGSIPGRLRGDQCIAAATTAVLAPWARPQPRGAWVRVAITAPDWESADAVLEAVLIKKYSSYCTNQKISPHVFSICFLPMKYSKNPYGK